MEETILKKDLTSEEIAFAVFCIENLAPALGKDAGEIYSLLAEKSDILYGYIIPCYDILHTQSREYIMSDIIHLMRERRIDV